MNEISASSHYEAGWYEIRLKGHLDSRWTAWFDGLSLSNEIDGTTIISGLIAGPGRLAWPAPESPRRRPTARLGYRDPKTCPTYPPSPLDSSHLYKWRTSCQS